MCCWCPDGLWCLQAHQTLQSAVRALYTCALPVYKYMHNLATTLQSCARKLSRLGTYSVHGSIRRLLGFRFAFRSLQAMGLLLASCGHKLNSPFSLLNMYRQVTRTESKSGAVVEHPTYFTSGCCSILPLFSDFPDVATCTCTSLLSF